MVHHPSVPLGNPNDLVLKTLVASARGDPFYQVLPFPTYLFARILHNSLPLVAIDTQSLPVLLIPEGPGVLPNILHVVQLLCAYCFGLVFRKYGTMGVLLGTARDSCDNGGFRAGCASFRVRTVAYGERWTTEGSKDTLFFCVCNSDVRHTVVI